MKKVSPMIALAAALSFAFAGCGKTAGQKKLIELYTSTTKTFSEIVQKINNAKTGEEVAAAWEAYAAAAESLEKTESAIIKEHAPQGDKEIEKLQEDLKKSVADFTTARDKAVEKFADNEKLQEVAKKFSVVKQEEKKEGEEKKEEEKK